MTCEYAQYIIYWLNYLKWENIIYVSQAGDNPHILTNFNKP